MAINEIIGYIDRFDSPDVISGWVGTKTHPESITPEITVEYSKNISVVINSDIVRHDLASSKKKLPIKKYQKNYITIRERYKDHDSSAIFRRLDTHLSPYGGHITASLILQAIGENIIDPGEPLTSLWTSGDLAERFFGCPLYESVKIFPENQLTNSRKLIHSKLEPGKHIGREYTW